MRRVESDRLPTPAPAPAGPVSRRRRLWHLPVRFHLAGLALVLAGLALVVGTSASFSADEGAVIIQARSLSGGRGWLVAHPLPSGDPAGVNYPLELSEHGTRGWAPYAKHPLYALILAAADRVGGVPVMVLLSLAGTVVAAGLAGALARRLDPALARPALWVTGLASPLLFDGFLLIAHTLGAALAAAAALAAVVAVERRRPVVAVLGGAALAACVLLRTEAVFLAGAMALVAGTVALRRRELRPIAATVAFVSVVAGGGAHLLDGWWTAHIVGAAVPAAPAVAAPAVAAPSGLVAGRIQGFLVTWLTPGYGGHPVTNLALLVMLAAVVLGAATVRWHPEDARRVRVLATVAAIGAVAALLAGPGNVVPGLLLAFPLAAAGLMLVGRRTVRSGMAAAGSGVCALFVVTVLATQYAKGGGGEWGGRYFAVAIPLAVPILLLAIWDQRSRVEPRVARWVVVALVVCSGVLTTMGVSALGSSHRANARLVAAVDGVGRSVAPDHPVMVTTEGSMPRFAWSTFYSQRWLLATPDGLGDLLGRLRAAGVIRVGFVTRDIVRDQARLDAAGVRVVSEDRSESTRRWYVLVLQV